MLFLVKFKVDSKNSVVYVIIIKLYFQFSLPYMEMSYLCIEGQVI